jgi:hypothetical protein
MSRKMFTARRTSPSASNTGRALTIDQRSSPSFELRKPTTVSGLNIPCRARRPGRLSGRNGAPVSSSNSNLVMTSGSGVCRSSSLEPKPIARAAASFA